jgi:hypothetical protein
VVVLVTAAIVFGGFAAGYAIYVSLNPPADLLVRLVQDCAANATSCDALRWTELDAPSLQNLTLLQRALDAYDHPGNYSRAVKSGDTLTYHTAREPARQMLAFLRDRLADQYPDQVVDGTYSGPVLYRHRPSGSDRVFELSRT